MQDLMVTFPKKSLQRPSLWVATSAYGHASVARYGQAGLLPWLAEAGADGVEIRRELLPESFEDGGFTDLGRACAEHGLAVIYSAADELWQGDIASPAVARRLAEAEALGAIAIKFSLGHYISGTSAAWTHLSEVLAASDVPLIMVENDQTTSGGTLEPLSVFLAAAEQAGCPLGMTFDIGNWRWTGDDAAAAAQRLGRYVRYMHCKGIDISQGRPHARVPSEAEFDAWQALMGHFPAGVPRAIEYPLQSTDPIQLTRQEIGRLATL
ncbi:sugar phosphate isomerase/epimerase family protein [Halomonas sp. WWR20]